MRGQVSQLKLRCLHSASPLEDGFVDASAVGSCPLPEQSSIYMEVSEVSELTDDRAPKPTLPPPTSVPPQPATPTPAATPVTRPPADTTQKPPVRKKGKPKSALVRDDWMMLAAAAVTGVGATLLADRVSEWLLSGRAFASLALVLTIGSGLLWGVHEAGAFLRAV